MIGYAEAGAKYAPAEKVAPNPKPTPPARGQGPKKKQHPKNAPGTGVGPEKPNLTIRPPPDVTPRLTAGGYVFPVYGPSSFGDTFGAPRGDIASGWHHGEDIFGQLGEPLLAVADGTVFSVGWNDIGGYRLWLRDKAGNEFYYAHLSAYSPFAVNGEQVKAGTVLGFMGNTGDASTTPYHLHFEIHPVGLLYLGYDGAVRPYPYLLAWEHLQDIEFAQVAGWAPPISPTSSAPKPGAILLSQTDISTADGLDPSSLERTLKQAGRTDSAGPSSTRLLGVVLPILELFAFAEDLVLEPAARAGARHGVEEDPEHDSGHEQGRVAGRVRGLALDSIRGAAKVFDRIAEALLDLLVGRDTGRGGGDLVAPTHELVVDLASG